MKVIAFVSVCLMVLSGAFAAESCQQDVTISCSQASPSLVLPRCNAIYGEYSRHGYFAVEMEAFANGYANLHLERSYDYLLSSAYFNNYQTNRGGFSKMFRKLSDDAWDKTIGIIKHITTRGGDMNFAQRSMMQKPSQRSNSTVELFELESLAKALDTQKELAEHAFHIHRKATRNSQHLHDPEIAQYLEEEFIEDQAQTIRQLAGHTSDLKQFIAASNGQDLTLALFMFDEYLKKTL